MVSKAEKKARKAEKQQAGARREQLSKHATRVVVVVLVALAIFVFGRGLFGGAPTMPPDRVAEHDQVRGNSEAGLIVTVYADYQCPSCAAEMQSIARAWPRVQNDLLLVFRHFPLDNHAHSFLAARYAEAAGRQGMFWEMSDVLFNNQPQWAPAREAQPLFDNYAEALGLDMNQLNTDLNDRAIRDKIVADQQGGVRAGVRATPTTFFNGRQVNSPRTAGAFREMVAEASSQD